jgi:HK97 family phage major capsid protein
MLTKGKRMPNTQQLREQRANAWEQMKEVMDNATGEGGTMTAEESAKYDRIEAEYDRLDSDIERAERHEKRAEQNSRVDRRGVVPADEDAPRDDDRSTEEVYAEAFQTFVRNGMAELDNDQRAILRSRAMDPKEIRAAQGVGTSSAGGYLVPEGFRQSIVERQKAYGAVQEVATVIQTSTGAALPWPTNDDTANVGALLAENTQATEQDLTLGTAQLGAYKYTSKIVRVSLEFMQDVDWLNVEQFIGRKFAERLGRIHNQHWTTGTGTAQPQGIVTGATSGVTAAGAAAITADELIDLQHSVDPAYRNERSRFMLSDTALKLVRKLKASGTGEYLFQTSTSADMPSLLAGSPFVINNDMAAPATGVKSVLYGDFEAGYVVRLVRAFDLIRLNERYADYGQVGFIGFDRADGLVQDANAYKALTQA